MTCLLFDPVLKTRMAAATTLATMLEGPSSVFLQVAEYKESAKAGSFTTLSSSLGQILMQLHTGLLHLVLNESHSGLLIIIFKALSLLISSAPFNRLPQDLLPNVISSVGKKAKELFTSLLDQSNLVAASISCLGATLNTSPPSPQVAAMLAAELSSGTNDNHTLLSTFFLFTDPVAHPVIRFEALQALRAAIHNYPSIMSSCWNQISSTVLELIESPYLDIAAHATSTTFCKGIPAQNLRPVDDKTMLSTIKMRTLCTNGHHLPLSEETLCTYFGYNIDQLDLCFLFLFCRVDTSSSRSFLKFINCLSSWLPVAAGPSST